LPPAFGVRQKWLDASIGVMYNGNTLGVVDDMGQPIIDDSFLILVNSYHDCVTYTLQESPQGRGWLIMDSDLNQPFKDKKLSKSQLDVYGRTVVLLMEDGAEEQAMVANESAGASEEQDPGQRQREPAKSMSEERKQKYRISRKPATLISRHKDIPAGKAEWGEPGDGGRTVTARTGSNPPASTLLPFFPSSPESLLFSGSTSIEPDKYLA
jgi:hypothetical protein